MFATADLQPAYVLHQRPWRDTSIIADVWCMHTGRQTLMVKGARKAQGKQPAKRTVLQPFHPLMVSYGGRGDMGYLKGLESAGVPFMLNGTALYCGLYINELVLKTLPINDPYPDLFAFYQEAIDNLATSIDLERSLRQFEQSLLQCLGYQINYTIDANNQQPVAKELWYQFVPLQGVHACAAPDPADVANSPSHLIFTGRDLLALNQRSTPALTSAALGTLSKIIARANLDALLDGKPLRSRELFRQLQATNKNALRTNASHTKAPL